MISRFLIALMVVCLFPGVGVACYEPDPPDPPSTYNRPEPPRPPYCLDAFSGTHTCEDWEIDGYNDEFRQYKYELEAYREELRQYVSDAEDFAYDASDYAECEISDLE